MFRAPRPPDPPAPGGATFRGAFISYPSKSRSPRVFGFAAPYLLSHIRLDRPTRDVQLDRPARGPASGLGDLFAGIDERHRGHRGVALSARRLHAE